MDCSCRGGPIHGRQAGHCVCACAMANPAPSSANDQLLVALAARLLQSQPPLGHGFIAQEFHAFQPPPQPVRRQTRYQRQDFPEQRTQGVIRSLLRRIADLEARISGDDARSTVSDRRVSPPPRHLRLRDLAARTIQAAFRRFLIRRSRALRDLKVLASIRSRLAKVRMSVSGKFNGSPRVLRRDAVDLLRRLNSVQSTDEMVLEEKELIGRKLAELLEYADVLLGTTPAKGIDIDRRMFSERGRESVEDIYDILESSLEEVEELDDRIPISDRNAIESLVSSLPLESIIEEQRRRIGRTRIEEDDEEDGLTYDGYGGIEDGSLPRKQINARISHGKTNLGRPTSPGLLAPLPLKMEPRRENMKKTSVVIN